MIEGCSPSVISSTSISLGRAIRARAISSIFCSPPDRVPARWPNRSSRKGKTSPTRCQFLVEPGGLRLAEAQIVGHAQVLKDRLLLRGVGDRLGVRCGAAAGW